MRDVAIVSYASAPNRRADPRNEVEILMPVVQAAVARSGIARPFDFTCSGSSDFLQGTPFAFVTALDAAGAWPPIAESHVEMDGAWALYEAWVKIQAGQAETALVYAFGKSSPGDLPEVLGMSDRVVVMHEGRITGELARPELNEEAVMHLATGSELQAA